MLFYFTLEALLVPKYLNFCPDFFGHVGKELNKKAWLNLKICGVTNWKINNCNTHISQYLNK